MSAPAPERRPVHVLQVGTDATVFDTDAASDTRERQLRYAAALDERAPGSRVTYLVVAPGRVESFATAGFRARAVSGSPLRLAAAIREVDRGDAIDLIATQTPFVDAWVALVVGRLLRVPVLAQIHFEPFDHVGTASTPLRRALRAARWVVAVVALRGCAAVRVVNRTTADRLARRGVRRVVVAPVPISPAAEASSRDTEVARDHIVLFVGRVAPEKNPRRWVAVAAQVAATDAHARFVVAGDGDALDDMKRAAAETGVADRFTWLGRVPHAQLHPLYASASVLLLTSDYEGFGRVLVEAARAGTPAVVTRVSGVGDVVVDGETGFVHDRDDVGGLAASVSRLLHDPDTRARLGTAAAAHADLAFDPLTLTDRWVDLLYRTATGARQNGYRIAV
ncbi:MAG TPA: glycosyltransferase [Acidimicrobiales bacterium]